jgi:hypothetical protein
VHDIGWRTFLMFGIFCGAMGVFIVFFAKETKGRSLEDMDILFGAVDENERRAAVEHTLNKGVATHIERTDEEAVYPKEDNKA